MTRPRNRFFRRITKAEHARGDTLTTLVWPRPPLTPEDVLAIGQAAQAIVDHLQSTAAACGHGPLYPRP